MDDHATRKFQKDKHQRAFLNEQTMLKALRKYKTAKEQGMNMTVYAIMEGLTHKQAVYLQANNK